MSSGLLILAIGLLGVVLLLHSTLGLLDLIARQVSRPTTYLSEARRRTSEWQRQTGWKE